MMMVDNRSRIVDAHNSGPHRCGGQIRILSCKRRSGPKSFVELRGPHNDGFLETGPSYVGAIKGFLVALGAVTKP